MRAPADLMRALREEAKRSLREQAFVTDGVLGVPTRLASQPDWGRPWDVTAICEAIDQAEVFLWAANELHLQRGADEPRLFWLMRPGAYRDSRRPWQVVGPDGTVLYRGLDVELAEELYHLDVTSHLHSADPDAPGQRPALVPALLPAEAVGGGRR